MLSRELVGHRRHILVALAIRQLIDANRHQAIERIGGPMSLHHPLHDLPTVTQATLNISCTEVLSHRWTRKPTASSKRVVKRAVVLSHHGTSFGDYPAGSAGHPPQPISEVHPHPAKIEVAPASGVQRVVAAAARGAARTAGRSPRRSHLDHQRAILDVEARDHHVLYSQKLFQ